MNGLWLIINNLGVIVETCANEEGPRMGNGSNLPVGYHAVKVPILSHVLMATELKEISHEA